MLEILLSFLDRLLFGLKLLIQVLHRLVVRLWHSALKIQCSLSFMKYHQTDVIEYDITSSCRGSLALRAAFNVVLVS